MKSQLSKLIEARSQKQMLKDYFFITCGIALYAIGYDAFILPEQLVQGGVAGISSLLFYAMKI